MIKSLKNSCVNVHIPKTAGSTFRSQIAYHTTVRGFDHIKTDDDDLTIIKEEFEKVMPELLSPEFCFVSGHYRVCEIAKILAPYRPNFSYITFVRDPCARTVSDYYYSLSEKNPSHELLRKRYPTFADYLCETTFRNRTCYFLAPFDGATVAETFAFIKNQFDFVGITESYEEHADLFFAELGLDRQPNQRLNVGPDQSAAAETLETYREEIAEAERDDIELFELIKNEWAKAS